MDHALEIIMISNHALEIIMSPAAVHILDCKVPMWCVRIPKIACLRR